MTTKYKSLRGIAYVDTENFMTEDDLRHICYLIGTNTPLTITSIYNAKAFYFECPAQYDFKKILENLYEKAFENEPFEKLIYLHGFCLHFYPQDYFDKERYDTSPFNFDDKSIESCLSLSVALRIVQDTDTDTLDLYTDTSF